MSMATDGPALPPDQEPGPAPGPGRLLLGLDLEMSVDGEGLRARAGITREIHGPGTDRLRTSVVAAWLDIVLGTSAVELMWPRPLLTLNLDVQILAPPPGAGSVEIFARPLKVGRTVSVLEAEVSVEGTMMGFGRGTFTSVPDPDAVLEARPPMRPPPGIERLSVPLAARAAIEVVEAGIAVMPNGPDARNGANTLAGGLIALVAEEAALSLTPGQTLALLHVDYLQAVRVGPAVATARIHNGVGRVEVRDAGRESRLAAVATTWALSLRS